jgi:serine/threonine protein kinase
VSHSAESAAHARVAELFEQAIALPPELRRGFLQEACKQEPEILERVLAIVSQDEEGTKDYLISPLPTVDVGRIEEICRPEGEPVEVPELIDGYRILRPLGAGGMGNVYLAEQEGCEPALVALKVMRLRSGIPRAAMRFERERRALERMTHENICRILGGGTTERGLPYFVMEYVPGAEPLATYARHGRLGLHERLKLFLRVCAAVDHGHGRGILHRDLKPSNILVGRDGAVKLIDFGIARSLQADSEIATRMTEVGQLFGTLQYISPEQLDGGQLDGEQLDGRALDVRSDVYSLGVVLYELLTDHPPYEVANLSLEDAARVIRESPPLRPSNPLLRGELDAILFRALEKTPQRRQASVEELALDIQRSMASELVPAGARGLARRFSRLAQRWSRQRPG